MIENYKNIENILTEIIPTSVQRYEDNDLDLLKGKLVKSNFGSDDNDNVELHVYSENGNYLEKEHNIKTWKSTQNTRYENVNVIQLDIQNDIRNLNFRRGNYKFIYNFFRNLLGNNEERGAFIYEISSTKQEIRCRLVDKSDSVLITQLNSLEDLINTSQTYKLDFLLNFSDNLTLKVINFKRINSFEFIVKLYEPLPDVIETLTSFWIVYDVLDSYADNIKLEQKPLEELPNTIKGPNFDVDVNYVIGSETQYKSWNELLGSNTSTQQNIVDNYFSSSLASLKTNIDYSDFNNFVHFGSATERIENFVYKIKLIETYDNRISLNSELNGSIGNSILNDKIAKNNLISNFDDFEKYLYFQASGSIYSNTLTASVEPYPKEPVYITSDSQSIWIDTAQKWEESRILWALEEQDSIAEPSYPFSLYSFSSSQVENWYNDVKAKAIEYDKNNIHSLVQTIPRNVLQSEQNQSYTLFVEMIGHHFDIIWTYINEINKIHTREENPKDGMSNDLLYDVSSNYGWKLSNGNTTKELWEYALGTNENNQQIQSGSNLNTIRTKTGKQRTQEIWRRIVNNLPYLLKTKGTSRSVRSLISTYGIPNTILREYEYSGLTKNNIKSKLNLDKYSYATTLNSQSQYITVPWENVFSSSISFVQDSEGDLSWSEVETTFASSLFTWNSGGEIFREIGTQKPDTINLRFKPYSTENFEYDSNIYNILSIGSGSNTKVSVNFEKTGSRDYYGNLHFYLSGSQGYKTASILDCYMLDGTFNNLMLKRLVSGERNDIQQTYEIHLYKEKYGKIVTCESSSLEIDATSNVDLQSYNSSWNNDETLFIGLENNDLNYLSFSGSIQELRFWNTPLQTSSFIGHTLSPRSYYGNTEMSTYDNLSLRVPFNDIDIRYSTTQSINSIHPSRNTIQYFSGSINTLTAYTHNLTDDNYESFNQTENITVPSLGPNNITDNKINIISNSLVRNLDYNQTAERLPNNQYTYQSNRVRVALSPQDTINEDIFYHTGYFEIDDYIGDPENEFSVEYKDLSNFSQNYWKKYSSRNNIRDYFELLKIFDFSLFKQVEQLLPFRANKILGLLWQQTALERSKQRSFKGIISNDNTYNFELIPTQSEFDVKIVDNGKGNIVYSSDINAYIFQQVKSSDSIGKYAYTISKSLGEISTEYSKYRGIFSGITSSISATYNDTLVENSAIFNNKKNESSQYKWDNHLKQDGNWITQSNSDYLREVLVSNIDSYPTYSYYKKVIGYYSSSYSESINLPYSTSLENSPFIPKDDLEIGTLRNRYDGCTLQNIRNNKGEYETPDGRPIIETFEVSGNQLFVQEQNSSGSIKIK